MNLYNTKLYAFLFAVCMPLLAGCPFGGGPARDHRCHAFLRTWDGPFTEGWLLAHGAAEGSPGLRAEPFASAVGVGRSGVEGSPGAHHARGCQG